MDSPGLEKFLFVVELSIHHEKGDAETSLIFISPRFSKTSIG
jgi:hypothetical protein